MLKDYQLQACKHAQKNPKTFLFMSCGTGKTYTALTISKGYKTLVLAPPKVVKAKVWEKEAKKWGIDVPNVASLYNKNVNTDGYDFLIIDECHRVKNSTTQISRRVHKAAIKTKRVLGLTGTWASNGYFDTWGMAKVLDIPMFKERYKNEFLKNYYNCYTLPNTPFLVLPSSLKNNTDIFKRIDNFSFIHVDEYDNYDENTIIIKSEKINDEFLIAQKYAVIGDKVLTALSKITYLRQLSNGFYYDENGKAIEVDSVKINEFLALFTQLKIKGRKIIVVYTFDHDKERISKIITEDEKLIQESSAEGLNLQEYDTIIFYNPTYSYQNYEQARKRILRLGQDKKCTIITLVREGSFDVAVERRKLTKISDNDMLKQYIEM